MLVSVSASSELMITMEVLIYPVLTLMILLVIYGMFGHGEEGTRNVNHSLDINIDKCASEHCVRCNKYKTVINRAATRYKSDASLRDALTNCSERISRAISTLHSDKKYHSTDKQQPNILHVEGLLAKPFWPEDDFVSDVTILESEVSTIVSEFEKVYHNVWPDGWLVNTTANGEWAVFHLINQGAFVKANCERCPKTCQLLKSLGGAMSMSENIFTNASFSVVQSGTDIAAHYGPTNVRIRCHLGLKVSDPQTSYIAVDDQRGSWQAGRCIIFDDSFQHQVHHDDISGEARAVLLIDMWHPQLTETERQLINNIFKFQKPQMPAVPTIPVPISTHL